jgi:pyridoxine kinase
MAMNRASDFVQLAIRTTYSYGSDPRHGVMFERLLGTLSKGELSYNYQTL